MLIGGFIYILFRKENLLMFNWFNLLGVENLINFFRNKVLFNKLIPNWVKFSLPDGIWLYSLTSLMIIIWERDSSISKYFWFLIIPILGLSAEFGQSINIVPGTYDKNDLIFCLFATITPFLLIKKENTMKTTRKKHIISIVGMLCFLIMLIGSTEDSEIEKDISSETVSYRLSATQLYSEYDANEVAADQKYKGKVIVVSGIIDDIGKDILDDIYVTLKGAEYFGSIQCFFSDAHVSKAAQLQKGQKLSVKGRCDGKMMNVLLRGCIVQ